MAIDVEAAEIAKWRLLLKSFQLFQDGFQSSVSKDVPASKVVTNSKAKPCSQNNNRRSFVIARVWSRRKSNHKNYKDQNCLLT